MPLVLVVDDDASVARAVCAAVRSLDHQAAMVQSGADALAYIRANPVDLVILDVAMPGMSGLDVLSSLANEKNIPALPVVVFCASPVDPDEVMRLGAVDLLLKSQCHQLPGLIERHLNRIPSDSASPRS